MNCANHPEVTATAFCRECGKPMCTACQRTALGSVYCAEHMPAAAPPPPYTAPPPPPSYASSPYTAPYTAATPPVYPAPPADPSVHPLLALILGFFPGVGAIYNGQYAKGLVHAVIFGLLVSIVGSTRSDGMGAFVGIMIAAWVIYQAFEAYHTARKRRYGMEIEEFSSLIEMRGAHRGVPVGAVLLIGIGFLLLLDTTGIVRIEDFERYWPVLLIVIGIYMLYARMTPAADPRSSEARR